MSRMYLHSSSTLHLHVYRQLQGNMNRRERLILLRWDCVRGGNMGGDRGKQYGWAWWLGCKRGGKKKEDAWHISIDLCLFFCPALSINSQVLSSSNHALRFSDFGLNPFSTTFSKEILFQLSCNRSFIYFFIVVLYKSRVTRPHISWPHKVHHKFVT